MAAMKVLFLVVAVSSLVSEAHVLPSLAGAATLPVIIGGKLLLVPKALALKAGIGMLGLKIAGGKYLKEKVYIPASLAGARATSGVLNIPQAMAEDKNGFIQKMFAKLPAMPAKWPAMPAFEVQPAKSHDFKTSFQIPAIPIPALQWYQKPLTLTLPRVVLYQPAVGSTITISKEQKPAEVPNPIVDPTPEEEVPVNRHY